MIILSASNLIKDFNEKSAPIRVINGISLDILDGDFVAVTGESGSGKSTLLYLLSGLELPSFGTVKYLDRDLSKMLDCEMAKLRRNGISFIYQFNNLLPNLSIYDNITLPKKIDRAFTKSEKEYLEELIKVAGIKHILKKLPNEVSGGEQQRAAIVRALFVRPKLLFADEPTGSLDSKSAETVIDLLQKINTDYNTTIIMVTHSSEQAAKAKRIIKIKDGKINN